MNCHKIAVLGLITRERCCNENGILYEKVEPCSDCSQGCPHLGVFDAFVEGSSPMKQQPLKKYSKCLLTTTKYISSTETSMKEKSTMKFSKALEPLLNGDFDNSDEKSLSLHSEDEDMDLNQTQNNSLSNDNEIPRPVIPIGPRFQAYVPKWEGSPSVRCYNNDDLKWLGVQVWPMPTISENITKSIGEGRPHSCSCKKPGSVECVRLHISEARELLKLEIGATFSSWKFDEMGEEVSGSWTLEEHKKFESLYKLNTSSNAKKFWKFAMKHFPSKSLKCMVNYYYNVHIPRRLSMETRRSLHEVDSDDDDQDENFNKKDSLTGIIIVNVTICIDTLAGIIIVNVTICR